MPVSVSIFHPSGCLIEQAMNMLDYMSKRRPHAHEDELVLQMLAARLFNSGASAMKLMMGGYYQSTVMVMRDILETTFLLDYFHSNRTRITEWRTCDRAHQAAAQRAHLKKMQL